MNKRNATPLAILALLAIGAAIIAGLAGTSAVNSDRASQPRSQDQQRSRAQTQTAPRSTPDPAVGVAARYALAARNWTPQTYRDSWKRQIALAGGRYRRALKARLPKPAELRALRQDRASSRAKLVRAERDRRAGSSSTRVVVTLSETTVAGGQTIRGQTVNQVDLRRVGGRWRVVGFTVLPGGTSGGSGS